MRCATRELGSDCNAMSRSGEWNMFTVASAWAAILRITQLPRRNQPSSGWRHKLTKAASKSRTSLTVPSGV
jgi:hypothetical protein